MSGARTNTVEVFVRFRRSTAKAVCVTGPGQSSDTWMPRSLVKNIESFDADAAPGRELMMVLPKWKAKAEGWI